MNSNEFPAQEVINGIEQDPEVGVSVRGNHYPPGKEPKDVTERKLHLFIEATNEMSLQRAKQEIVRIIKEQLAEFAATSRQMGPPTGRYKVV